MISNGEFWSIVVPYYKNKQYLPGLCESLYEHADMPYELVIHNDSAIEGPPIVSAGLKVSIEIRNFGSNFGLSRALHNAVRVSSSDYILFLNQDCVMVRPCLKLLKQVLARPYIGLVMLQDVRESAPESCNLDGGSFTLLTGIGSGAMLAFRRDFWESVGGTDLEADSGRSDTTIIYRMWQAGYWRAVLLGPRYFRNLSAEQNNKDTSIGPYGTDCGFPRLWKLSEEEYKAQSKERMNACCHHIDVEEHKPEGVSNMAYWDAYSQTLMREQGKPSTINWAAAKYGQAKWRKEIEHDFLLR